MDVNSPGVVSCRISLYELEGNFSEASPPLTKHQALIAAERCLYCFDAPCVTACPTGIDIPAFIHRVAQGNSRGAAEAILTANPLGGMCARVCPTETLCEQACVRSASEGNPVEIGRLQRFATDDFFANADARPLFNRGQTTGRRVAIVGAGPAGLAAAHVLARLGHEIDLFDAHDKLGGLNEYGLATYKTTGNFAQREIEWLLSIGGISIKCNQRMGRDFALGQLITEYDAVFLGLGQKGANELVLHDEPNEHVRSAVDFIAELRQADSLDKVAVGRSVVVIGGGMTAVDAAVQCRKLGAREVTIVYRRGADKLSASLYEQDWARKNGVQIRCWASPKNLIIEDGQLRGLRCAVTADKDGELIETGESFDVSADLVLKAIGQHFVSDGIDGITLKNGLILTDEDGHSSHSRVWAGGDCRFGSRDLTVEAVEHGKRSAISINAFLKG